MAITNGYCTLADLKSHTSISDTDDDTELEYAIEAASRKIDGVCGRRFWKDAADRTAYFTPTHGQTLWLGPHPDVADVATVTTLTVDTNGDGTFNETWTAGTHFFLAPRTAAEGVYWRVEALPSGGRRWPAGTDVVKIVGKFGIDGAPDAIREACLIQAAKIFQVAKDGGGGFSDFSQGGGGIQSMFLERSATMLLEEHIHPTRRIMVG